MSVRVLVVDDHATLRRSLIQALECEPGLEVIAEASDGETGVQLAMETKPDVVIMDVVMPRLNGIDATLRITHDCLGVPVIGLSVHASRAYIDRMFKAGASAYVLKGDINEVINAINAVRRGETYLSPGAVNPDY